MNKQLRTLALAAMLVGKLAAMGQTDVTSSIVNPSFDGRGFGGWRNKGFQTQTNSAFTGKTYHAYAEKWVSTNSTMSDSYLLQTITGLTNGQYTLKANAQNINQNATSTAQTGAYLVGNEHQTTVTSADTYSVTFYVVDGTAEIGFKLENCSGNWVACDNFALTLDATGVSYLRMGLSALVTKGQALQSSSMQSAALSTLNSAISTASSYTSNGSESNVVSAYATLKAAIKNAENSIFYTKTSTSGTVPTVVADSRYQVGTNIAFARSTVTGSNIIEQGYCYSTTNTTPTVADDRTTRYLDHVGYIHILDNLTPGTTYYIRPYAVNSSYGVGYGDVMRIYTLPRSGSLGYNFNTSGDSDIDARLLGSMESLKGYWNACTSIVGYWPTANYNSGVTTADCSYGGWTRFGPSTDYQATGTAMHESLHGIGVGTDVTFAEHMEVYNGDAGSSYGAWLGKRAKQLTQFWDNNSTEYITGGGSHVWATNGSNMTSFTINGANEDAHTDLQYYGDGLLAQALCEDGMCPVAYQSFLPGYCFKHTDNTKYYIRNTDESYGLNTSTYLYATGTTLKWKTYASNSAATSDDNAAWYIEFDPATQYYYFKNVSTGKYLYSSGGSFSVSGTTKDSNTQIHLHLGWWDATFGSGTAAVSKDTYYLMHPAATAHPVSLTAAASNAVGTQEYYGYADRTAARWMILTATDMDGIEAAVVETERNKVTDIISKVRLMAATSHTDDTGSADATLESTLSSIESSLSSATASQSATYYDDVLSACKTFMQNTTPGASGYNITFLVSEPGMASTDGWSGTTPTIGYEAGEFFQKTFDFYQTLSTMPAGRYKMKMQAYERPGAAADVFSDYMAGTSTHPVTAQIYISTASQTINNISVAARTTALGTGSESEVTYDETTYYIPNNMQAGANYFSNSLYDNSVEIEEFSGGTLQFGIKNTTNVTSDWTMFDNLRLYYYGGQTDVEVLSLKEQLVADGFNKITALPDDYSPFFFVLYDHDQDLAMTMKNGNQQGTSNKAMWYDMDINPRTDKTALWTLDAYAQDETGYQIVANTTNPDYMLQTEWNAGWNFRCSDNGGGTTGWGRTSFAYLPDGYWTIQNGVYPDTGYLGPWENVITDDAETALNKTGTSIGHFDIFTIQRGDWVKMFDTSVPNATYESPINISYVLENPGGERRTSIGWKMENGNWGTQNNTALEGKVGEYYLQRWNANGIGDADIYQEIQGLPDGYYRFSAITIGRENFYLYANNETASAPLGNNGIRINVVVQVTNGTLRVGAKAESTTSQWVAFDDAKLEYLGASIPSYNVGNPASDIAEGAYIQSLDTWTLNFPDATSNVQGSVFAILDNDAKVSLYKDDIKIGDYMIDVEGTAVIVDFNNLALETEASYRLDFPANAVGYAGKVSNEAVSINFQTPALFDGTYYLYNTYTNQYLSRGGEWATACILDDWGLAMIVQTNDEGKTTLKYFDSQAYLYNDAYCYGDGANGLNFTVTKTGTNYKFFNQSTNNSYLAVYEGRAVGDGRENDNLVGTSNVWKLESTAEHVANYTRNADAQAVAAATAASITGISTFADLEALVADTYVEENITIMGEKAERYEGYAAQAQVLTESEYYKETVENLPNGLYRLTVDAFQRAAGFNDVANADGARGCIYLYANDAKTQLKSVMEYAATTTYTGDETWADQEYNGLHYPNSESAAYKALSTGNYRNVVYVYVSDGTLTFGINNPNRLGNDLSRGTWAVFQNFQLERMDPIGDITNDSNISNEDLTALLNIILNKGDNEQYNHKAADVNKDGQISVGDITALVNLIRQK